MKIVLHPYAAKLRDPSKRNAKNYPWFDKVVARLNALGHEVIQIGIAGEARIEGVAQFIQNWPLVKLGDVINNADVWLAVDSFLPHFCFSERLKSGVVIWSVSDPAIWSHSENTNLLKSREYLRPLQYQDWNQIEYNEAAFVLPQVVVDAVLNHVSNSQSVRPTNRTRPVPRSLPMATESQNASPA